MPRYKEGKLGGEKGQKFGNVGRAGEDPYLLQLEEGQEAAFCHQCHALYQGKRWFFDENLYNQMKGSGRAGEVLCPTCRKIKDHYPEGFLTLSGEFFTQHREEIIRALEKEASRVSARNVLDRIIQMVPEGQTLVVETTTEKLAQHLGRAIYKAYKGKLDFRWSDANPLVRVYWSR